jgi:hypothetical protein
VVFSSLDPDMIRAEANTPWGVRALKGYLNFAKNGITARPEISPGAEASNEHEAAIGSVLKSQGYDVVPQIGVSGYFIDLAVRRKSLAHSCSESNLMERAITQADPPGIATDSVK